MGNWISDRGRRHCRVAGGRRDLSTLQGPHEASSERRAAWHVRAMNQGRKRRDQVDAAVMPLVRRQRRPTSTSRAGLQSRQLPAHAGDAGTDQRLVADEPEGKADQDRREARKPRPLCRVSDGRSRHSQISLRRHLAADRGTAAAARCGARVKHSFVIRHGKLTGGRCPNDEKHRPAPLAAAQTPTTRQKPPAPETAASKLVRKREPSMLVSGEFR
jgi:hypothetical protein